jgi:regulator of protease activity HflC (stomatin/prohibitin superfamily)
VAADAEAYATGVVAEAIAKGGLEAVQYNIALEQVKALGTMAARPGTQTVIVPADAADAFGKAFQMLKGRG